MYLQDIQLAMNRIAEYLAGYDFEMYYLRNKASHEYFGVDYEIIWDVATNYLPDNKRQIDKIIDQEK